MRTRCLVVILLCCIPALADKNRREAEKLMTGMQASLQRVGTVQQSSGGSRDGQSCEVAWTESVLVSDSLGCKATFSQAGADVQTCAKEGTAEKSIVSNEWNNRISLDLRSLDAASVGLKERKNETLNDFPTSTRDKTYEFSFATRRHYRVISWSSRLKYTSRGSKSLERGDVRTDHQEGVWDQFTFLVSDRPEGEKIVKEFSQAINLCSASKK